MINFSLSFDFSTWKFWRNGGLVDANDPTQQKLRSIAKQISSHTGVPLNNNVRVLYHNAAELAGSLRENTCHLDVYQGIWNKEKFGFVNQKNDDELATIVGHGIARCVIDYKIKNKSINDLSNDQKVIEADQLGADLMARAGFNPNAAVQVLKNVREIAKTRKITNLFGNIDLQRAAILEKHLSKKP